jgi:hypothetical protein
MTTTLAKAIPKSVLATLDKRWRDADTGYRAFESIFNERGRAVDPSYYALAPLTGFTIAEFSAMTRDRVFEDCVLESGDINEHAVHALQDFCNDVYKAWGIYQQRVELAGKTARKCPVKDLVRK